MKDGKNMADMKIENATDAPIVNTTTEAFQFSPDQVRKMMDLGLISQELGEVFFSHLESSDRFNSEMRQMLSNNPNPTPEDWLALHKKCYPLNTNEEKETYQDHTMKYIEVLQVLESKKDMLSSDLINLNLDLPALFKNMDQEKYFGVTKILLDRAYHLPELLKEATVRHISGNDYEIKASIKQGSGAIGLEYDFTASSTEEANLIFEDYKNRMQGEAQKVWLAFWKTANEKKLFHYGASLTEIMSKLSDENREFYFSTKEKVNFWLNAKLLSRTKLTIECDVKSRGKKTQRLNVPHRMLEITAKLSDIEENNYPNEMAVSVLDPLNFKEKSNIAASIANSTLKLHPTEIVLALSLQARGAQRKGKDAMIWKEGDLIEQANLSATADKNKSVARARLKAKLENYKDAGIIENHVKDKDVYYIKSENQKKTS